MDKGKDFTEVLWREGTTALLRVDPIELCSTAKGLFVRPDARDPNRDAWLLKGCGQKLHLRELIMLSFVAAFLTTPQEPRKFSITYERQYSIFHELS